MLISKLYEALINNYYPANNNTRVATGGPKGPNDPNNMFSKIILIVLLILMCIITYNLYFSN